MKIYTKQGDKGKTSVRNKRLLKSHPIIKTLSYIDDLQSSIGFLIFYSKDEQTEMYKEIQQELMRISSVISGYEVERNYMLEKDLENQIDKITKNLKPLTNFILSGYGDNHLELYAHSCRTKTRLLECNLPEDIHHSIKSFINRLSDYFFTIVRLYNTNELRFIIKDNVVSK